MKVTICIGSSCHLKGSRQIVERLQALGADCTGLGARAGMLWPARWQAVQADWPERFSEVPVEITVEVDLL